MRPLLPDQPRNTGGVDWPAVLTGLTFFSAVNFVVTQFLAAHFLFQAALGSAIVRISHWGIYPPWRWLVWTFRFGFSEDPRVRQPLFVAGITVLISLFVAAMLIRYMVAKHTRSLTRNLDQLHGSAAFMNEQEVRDSPFLRAKTGAVIGGWEPKPNQVLYLRDDSDGHIVAFAQTGLGKTGGLAAPTALSNPEASMLILDPKGELHLHTSGYRAAVGNRVFRFSPVELSTSRFNIFAEMRLTTIHAVQDAQIMAEMLCHVPGQDSSDPHWDDIAASLVAGVLLHEGYKALNEKRVVTGRDISRALNPPDRQFADVLQEMLTYEHDPTGRHGWVYRNSQGKNVHTKVHPVVMQTATQMLDRTTKKGPTEEYSGCLSAAQKRFDIFRDPLIINATSTSDFTIDQLVNYDQPVTLYIVVPLGDEARLLHLMRTLFTVFFGRLTELDRIKTPNRYPFIWLMDEFATLGRLDIFSKLMPKARGFGIKVYLICQSLKQILDAYGAYQSIVDNCNLLLSYAPGPDRDTAQMLSDMSGMRTVLHESASFSGERYGPSKRQITTHIQAQQRALLTPDEIRRLRPPIKNGSKVVEPGDMLIFPSGHKPIYGRQGLYWFDPVFNQRSAIPELTAWPAI